MIYWLGADPASAFPPLNLALDEPNGLLAAGGDLHPQRLINAYRHGVFPWYSDDQPILWWSPDPRCILPCAEFHLSRRMRRELRQTDVRLTTDQAFKEVLEGCAHTTRSQNQGENHGTWIVPAMKRAYALLYRLGYAHSLEVWHGNELVGGLYGVLLGRMFYAESMFTRGYSGSKIALLALCRILQRGGAQFIDCQLSSPHLQRLGAREISRETFCSRIGAELEQPLTGGWPRDGLPAPATLIEPLL